MAKCETLHEKSFLPLKRTHKLPGRSLTVRLGNALECNAQTVGLGISSHLERAERTGGPGGRITFGQCFSLRILFNSELSKRESFAIYSARGAVLG
jgi:hypothetical protein